MSTVLDSITLGSLRHRLSLVLLIINSLTEYAVFGLLTFCLISDFLLFLSPASASYVWW